MPSSTGSTRSDPAPGPQFRRAGPVDAVALTDLERAAGLAGLGQVFPPDRFPYPTGDVLARWHLVLADPDVVVDVLDVADGEDGAGPRRLGCLVAYDGGGTLRHLAVDPGSWGLGWGALAVDRAVAAWRAAGLGSARLWCLAENHRARALYERLGWRATGAAQEAAWPPFPAEVEYAVELAPEAPVGDAAVTDAVTDAVARGVAR